MVKSRKNQLFSEYFEEWIGLYKVGAIRAITLKKYYRSQQYLEELAPDLRVKELTRRNYQQLLNDYAKAHEKQTTMDFHHQVKGAILDALDGGLIDQNPTRKIIIKGKVPREKRQKFLNQYEVQILIRQMNLAPEINWDWFILLVLKTGLRFSEALALTPNDFDFSTQKLIVEKTWDYKSVKGTFQPTKNESSKRKIQLDWQFARQFSQLIKDIPADQPIFMKGRVFNSTVNNRLQVLCHKAEVPSWKNVKNSYTDLIEEEILPLQKR